MANIVEFFVPHEVIRLTKEAVWLSDQTEITHAGTCQLFFRSIERVPGSAARGYQLRVGKEVKPISVEDTAYFVTQISGSPETGYQLRLSDGTLEPLVPATLAYEPGRLTCHLARGEEAKFLRAPYIDLLRHLRESEVQYYLEINGTPVVLSRKMTHNGC